MARYISAAKARNLAYSWHGGQCSALYAYASSGLIEDPLTLLAEIRKCENMASTKTACREVVSLYRFARDCSRRIPGRYPFAAPWAKV